MKNLESKLITRSKIISYIYQSELFNKEINTVFAFENGDFSSKDLKKIEKIKELYPKLKKVITKYTKKEWEWKRILPLERAILIYGAFELTFIDKALVINEMVIISRGYIPNDSYKFINSILDKVGDFYEKIKTS